MGVRQVAIGVRRPMSTDIEEMCRQCNGKCCRYFCFQIDEPDTFEEYENLRWFILHKGITIHIDEGDWYISIENECRNLTADGRCSDYAHRPMICRSYSSEGCDATGGDYEYEELFTTADEIAAYARKKLGPQKYDKKWAKMCGLPAPEKKASGNKGGKKKKKHKKKHKR